MARKKRDSRKSRTVSASAAVPATGTPEISVVSPVYNEEASLTEFHRRVTETLQSYGRSYEIVLVEDGSSDATPQMLKDLAEKDDHVVVLYFSRNYGQWAGVAAGLEHSRGEYVVVMDSDLQHKPEEIPALVEKCREGYDMASGWRQDRQEGFFIRRIPSLIANWMLRTVTKCPAHDMGGFKCMRGEFARTIQLTPGSHRFLPALVYMAGGSIAEVPISSPPREKGRSNYGLTRIPNVALDIISLWFQAAYLGRPLHLLGKLSAFLVGLGIVIILCLLYPKLAHGTPMANRPGFFIAMLSIAAGIQCLVMGFLADIMSRMYYATQDKRPYHVREKVGGEGG
jgi:glycosyltransferase involved in cell wall biosynthesis